MHDENQIELENLTTPLETIDLTDTQCLDPLIKWLGWEVFNDRPLSIPRKIAAVCGILTGGLAASFIYDIGGRVGEIMGRGMGASPQGIVAMRTFMAVGTIIPRVALGSVAAQDTFMEFVRHYEEPVHLPRKKNQAALRFFANLISHTLCATAGLMGIYVHFYFFNTNIYLRYALIPAVFISTDLITQTVFSKKVAWAFDVNSLGESDQVIEMRAQLLSQLHKAGNAIYEMNDNEYDIFYLDMVQGSNTPAKLKKLFSLQEKNPSPVLPETWLHTVAGGIGYSFAAVSSYIGVSVISKMMAEWFCKCLNIKDPETEQSIAYMLTVSTFIPYVTLGSTAARASFKKQVDIFYGRKKPPSPVKTGHPTLRKVLSWTAPVLGTISAAPNAFWALISKPWYMKAASVTCVSQATVYTDALQKYFRRTVNFYESCTGQSETIAKQNLIDKIEHLDPVITQLPDEQIIALFSLVSDQNSPAVKEVMAPQYSRKTEKKSFWSHFIPGYQRVEEPDVENGGQCLGKFF